MLIWGTAPLGVFFEPVIAEIWLMIKRREGGRALIVPRERGWTSGHSSHPWRPLGEWVPLGPLALDPSYPTLYPAGRLYAENYEMQGIGGREDLPPPRHTIAKKKKKKRNGYFEMAAKPWLYPGCDWRVDLDNLALSKAGLITVYHHLGQVNFCRVFP